jgi:hypothetical protein
MPKEAFRDINEVSKSSAMLRLEGYAIWELVYRIDIIEKETTMARFPLKEAEVAELADKMIAGLTENPAVYPTLPVAVADLTTSKNEFLAAKSDVVAAKAAFEAALAAKDAAKKTLEGQMKDDLRYAENTAHFDDAKLKLIGWGAKRSSVLLTAPGQTLELTVPMQGDGSVMLAWKGPIDGGAVQAYMVMRRLRTEGAWEDAATAVITEAMLTNQPKGIEMEYQIIAVNKAGEGKASNTAMVVL